MLPTTLSLHEVVIVAFFFSTYKHLVLDVITVNYKILHVRCKLTML